MKNEVNEKEIKNNVIGTTFLQRTSLKNFQGDLKEHDQTLIDMLKESIKKGFDAPIYVWHGNENLILDGHQRLKALNELASEGYMLPADNIPVVEIVADTEKEAKRKVLEYNSKYAMVNFEFMASRSEGVNMDGINIEGFNPETEDDEKKKEIEDTVPEIKSMGIIKVGDIIQLGKHRLMCGDSTQKANIENLMGGGTADMYLTDPPYNVDYEGKTKDALKIQNDNKTDDEFLQFLTEAFGAVTDHLKEGGVFYIRHADSEGHNFRHACKLTGRTVRQCLVWNKNSMVLGRQDYQRKHEPCLYGRKDGAGHYRGSDRSQTTVLDFQRPSSSKLHPTMKPIELLEYQINNSSKEKDIVLDTFLGSGSTLIACEKTNRICYGMELDEHYCEVIIQRYCEYVNDYKITINGKEANRQTLTSKHTDGKKTK